MQITRHDEPLQTIGDPQKVGEKLPEFTLTDAVGQTVASKDLLNKPTLISVVPDINTRVCSISTKRFNQEVDQYPEINFLTISTNTPEQQKDWCAAEGVANMQLFSDQELDFGKKTGLYISEAGVDSRSIWVVDQAGTIVYQELVPEMTHEPNYAAALGFISAL
ncbi:thiol peroxidase [Ligilactobacillus salitolerans]|uniref:Thiol peroxidase n=1 Tax=Ligilactobacillus salitolerans TaxID=1808352 RepID=A0A401ISR0_9LACO|nr:thiol peroxidase [Ligilactobacillus salitolerans]GBG94583.1 thiol peroxidase [Ligilactobacillus salitolerans]